MVRRRRGSPEGSGLGMAIYPIAPKLAAVGEVVLLEATSCVSPDGHQQGTFMYWTKHNKNHHTATGPGGEWSVENRVGSWMVFDPAEDMAVFTGCADAAAGKRLADWLAAQTYE